MTNQEIFNLIARFEQSSACVMKLTMGDFSLELDKGSNASAAIPAASCRPESSVLPYDLEDEQHTITAPLVGTFYAAASPDAEPFVLKGVSVKKGQTVCLIEAMKTISEIPAPCDCIITDVVKNNADLASFGEVLFRYKPC